MDLKRRVIWMAKKSRGKASIVFDVKACLNEIDRIGQSKKELRAEEKHGIHSLKQKSHSLSVCQNFVKWVRQHFDVKRVYQLTEEHYQEYMNHMEQLGTSAGHRQNIETGLRHLQKGMNARSERFRKEKVTFVPEKRVTPYKSQERPRNRSYTLSEYQAILDHVSPAVKEAVGLMREMGLRIKEAVNVRVEHFVSNREGWKLMIEKGSGVTKGGRFRETPVPKRFERELERMLAGKEPEECLVTIKYDSVRRAVNLACRKAGIIQDGRGCHGFRHAYARERVSELLAEKGIGEEGERMLQRVLSNREDHRRADYGIFLPKDRRLFNKVREVVNQVHSEIGHGEDRWALAEVYMKN